MICFLGLLQNFIVIKSQIQFHNNNKQKTDIKTGWINFSFRNGFV